MRAPLAGDRACPRPRRPRRRRGSRRVPRAHRHRGAAREPSRRARGTRSDARLDPPSCPLFVRLEPRMGRIAARVDGRVGGARRAARRLLATCHSRAASRSAPAVADRSADSWARRSVACASTLRGRVAGYQIEAGATAPDRPANTHFSQARRRAFKAVDPRSSWRRRPHSRRCRVARGGLR